MTAVGYIRQSKRADLDVALSYDAQLAAIHRLAERDGVAPESVRIFADMGRSGAAGKEKQRPGYLEVLATIESGGVDALYTLSLTRIARSAGELERVADLCQSRSVRLVTDKEGTHDPTNPMQAALFGMIGVFARFERELAVQRARDNVAVRRGRGDRMGRIPYGDRPGDRPAAVEAAWMATRSLGGAALELNRQKVPSWSGRAWTPTAVRLVLARVAPGTVPALHARRGVKPSSPFLLYRLLQCHCGRTLTASRDGRGNRDVVYRCHAADSLPEHPRPYRVRESAILPWIKAEAARFRVPVDAIERDAVSETERAKLARKRELVIDSYTDGKIEKPERDRRLDGIDSALADIVDVAALVDVPQSIDWLGWAPERINAILRTYWFAVVLGPDLLPLRPERRIPDEYWT